MGFNVIKCSSLDRGRNMQDIEDIGSTSADDIGLVERWATSLIDVPGRIACVVFVRGCSIKCKDCHNCALQDKLGGGRLMHAAALADAINRKHLPEWVCFQGGEPMDQAKFVTSVVALLEPRFKVAIYTGYSTPRAFRRAPALLGTPSVQMLKAGPFIGARRVHGRFLATANQQLQLKGPDGCWRRLDWMNLDSTALCDALR
jgi:hypothetical protein